MNAGTITSIGLVLDIIGAIALFWFGLPASIYRGGVEHYIVEQSDEAEAQKARWYDRISKIGLGLLIAGFVLQLIGSLKL